MYEELLHRFTEMSQDVLGENLVGVYLHGSLAMGGFNPAKSDLDLLVVVEDAVMDETKIKFLRQVVKLNEEAPAKGIEMSIVRRKYISPFVYPTPYELHFSVAHLRRFYEDPKAYVEQLRGTDKDLAAHFAIVHRFGVALYGPKAKEIFSQVPKADYADSIWYDVGGAKEEILENPMYLTLNLCRALAYLKADLVLSKQTGGAWGLQNVPAEYHGLIRAALHSYETDQTMELDPAEAVGFAAYMIGEIQRYWIDSSDCQELQCLISPFGTLPSLKFVVVCSFYQGKYMLSRHKKRTTWESQGGHIEPGETPMDAARRELYEESGVTDATLYPVCDYLGYRGGGSANGAVFFADIHALGQLPESEMAEIGLFDELPENMTYPLVTPALMAEAKRMKSNL